MSLLAPGHHLYPAEDGAWRCSAPQDRFVRITGDNAVLAAFQQVVHGAVKPAELAESARLGDAVCSGLDGEQRASVIRLRDMFAERDLLQPASQPDTARSAAARIWIEGTNPLASTIAGLLPGSAQVVRDPVDEGAVDAPDMVISCAGWLPDTRWRRLDAWCAERGVAWHRVHAEGLGFFLGPMTVPGVSATYRDLRGRRLAASGVADELLAQWAYLDNPEQTPPPVPWPDEPGLAVIAGLLAQDVQTYLRTGRPRLVNIQLEVDLDTARLTHHPVLPLPVTADR